MNPSRNISKRMCLVLAFGFLSCGGWVLAHDSGKSKGKKAPKQSADTPVGNAIQMVTQGQQTFRFDTFGDEAFWSDALQLQKAIEGANFGGVGTGISPKDALALGLKVDADALPQNLVEQLRHGKVDLNDPAVTLEL